MYHDAPEGLGPLNFVHKRILGAVGGFVSGGPTGAVSGFLTGGGGGGGGAPAPSSRSPFQIRRNVRNARHCDSMGRLTAAGVAAGAICDDTLTLDPSTLNGCPEGTVTTESGCVSPVSPRGQREGLSTAVLGQYGAGVLPTRFDVMTFDCPRGMVLGTDEICYNRKDISNKERKWPRGTRPLGTAGEMAALRKAAAFGRRMEGAVKRMQKIGVLKKPAPRRAPKPKMLMPPRDGVSVVNVE